MLEKEEDLKELPLDELEVRLDLLLEDKMRVLLNRNKNRLRLRKLRDFEVLKDKIEGDKLNEKL